MFALYNFELSRTDFKPRQFHIFNYMSRNCKEIIIFKARIDEKIFLLITYT